MSGSQFRDLADSTGDWIQMAGAARIGVVEWPEALSDGFVLIELHRIGNVIGLCRNKNHWFGRSNAAKASMAPVAVQN